MCIYSKYSFDIVSKTSGTIKLVKALAIGNGSMLLGGGRMTKEDEIDISLFAKQAPVAYEVLIEKLHNHINSITDDELKASTLVELRVLAEKMKIDGESVWEIADGWKINMPYMTLRHCPMKEHLNANCATCPYNENYTYTMPNGKTMKLRRVKLSDCTFYLTD